MWTTGNRVRYSRDGLRDSTDLTDAEWAEIKPLIPPARGGGNKRTVDIREVANGRRASSTAAVSWASSAAVMVVDIADLPVFCSRMLVVCGVIYGEYTNDHTVNKLHYILLNGTPFVD